MKTTTNPAELMRDALVSPSGGIVNLVERLLTVCKHHLQFSWQDGHCRVLSFGNGLEELVDVQLPKYAFRAVLARIAVLCNEYEPDSVSPYGGHGRLRVGGDTSTDLNVNFVNTADEQYLEIGPA